MLITRFDVIRLAYSAPSADVERSWVVLPSPDELWRPEVYPDAEVLPCRPLAINAKSSGANRRKRTRAYSKRSILEAQRAAEMDKIDVIDMNEALMTAQGLRGSTLNRGSVGSDGETGASGGGSGVPMYARRRMEENMTMSDAERSIFNKLGESSSPKNKPTYTELGLRGRADKKGVMWKTGPCPSWYTPWRKRCFVLKGNFLYYFDGDTHSDPPVLGAIFVKNAIIEKISLPFATYVLSVSPLVKRRVNWEGDDESSIFYLKFKSEEDRIEWFDVLHKVSFGNA